MFAPVLWLAASSLLRRLLSACFIFDSTCACRVHCVSPRPKDKGLCASSVRLVWQQRVVTWRLHGGRMCHEVWAQDTILTQVCCEGNRTGCCASWGTALRYAPPAYVPHAPWAVLEGCGGGGVTCHHWLSGFWPDGDSQSPCREAVHLFLLGNALGLPGGGSGKIC